MANDRIQYALEKGTELRTSSKNLFGIPTGEKRVYTIEKALGQGGFGITYLATRKIGNITQVFAIKEFFVKGKCWREAGNPRMMFPEAVEAKHDVNGWLHEFENEAELLNQICKKTPNIVQVNEVFRANDTAYYVMEYLEGGSLRDVVKQGALQEEVALSYLLPVVKAVHMLHTMEQPLLHCDIKHDNIMLRKHIDGVIEPVLIDFGESRHFNEKGNLTTTHTTDGCSRGFAPMEQYLGITTFNPQVDVYALAATMYYVVTGEEPPFADDVTETRVLGKLPIGLSDSLKKAIVHGMQKDKDQRTRDARTFFKELSGIEIEEFGQATTIVSPELPIGYSLKNKGKSYLITSIAGHEDFYIRYKAACVDEKYNPSSDTRLLDYYVVYEFFDKQNNRRLEDKSVVANGNTDIARNHFLSLCKKATKGEINGVFHNTSGNGWITVSSNNTFYLIEDAHYRKSQLWKRILTYGGIGMGGILLVIGGIYFYNGIKKEKWEMSQRLTNAIITSNAESLRVFAEEYDSSRAYLPYAKICFGNGDYTTAKIFAAKAKEASPQDSVAILSLYADIHEKESLLLQQGEMKRKELAFDSLYNLAKGQYDAKQFLLAKETLNKLDSDFLSRQQVIDLLNDINTFINSDEKEEIFNNLLKVAESQYNHKLYKEAIATIEKMDREHRSRREVTVLLNKIESGIKTQELEKQYSDYLSKAQTAYKANPRRLDEALEYLKKIQSMGSDYYTRFPVKALMDDIGSKIDPSSILKDAEKKGQWDKVRELALSDYLPACGSLAKHYLKTGDTDAHCRAYYWAKKSSTVDREYVLGMLKSYGFLKDDGIPVVECNNIKY